jgi:hypothetical protein
MERGDVLTVAGTGAGHTVTGMPARAFVVARGACVGMCCASVTLRPKAYTGTPQVRPRGSLVLAAGAGTRAPSGGVTRQGVVLTDLQSPVDCR